MNDDGLLVWVGEGGSLSVPQWGTDGPTLLGKTLKWGTPFKGICIDKSTGEETTFCPVGNSMPDYNLGLSTSLNWKGLSLYALFTRSAGFDIYNLPLAWGLRDRNTGLSSQTGTPEAERKPIGYYDLWYEAMGGGPNTSFAEDGTFTKLRELSVAYRFTPAALTRIPGLRRFSSIGLNVTGRNVLTWTDYRGWDPEVGLEGGGTGSAAIARIDGFAYPNSRNWTVSVEFVF